ncbi:uncharacterized protein LOC122274656 [Carya illinoinensis]|uniref:uncharacterized protein LOC122274656 n=1 Tax=Carya illinoinensis TaxID=32201 RepID=UPI001C7220E5|nr:uncharacterized protein LOC122274656 [Carya illinoinensis]
MERESSLDDEPQVEANNTTEGASSSDFNQTWDEYQEWRWQDNTHLDHMTILLAAVEEEESIGQVVERMPQHNIGLRGREYIVAILNGHPKNCRNMFRMEVYAFQALCNTLHTNAILESTREVSVEEVVAMFTFTVGHGTIQRVTGDRFQHSSETVNRHVNAVMRELCRLAPKVIAPTHVTGVVPYIESNPKHYTWFEKCYGAIDGTYIDTWVLAEATNAYISRYHLVSKNVLAACDFDMKFTFIYAGWEGTAHDARIFMNALTRLRINFPLPPEGYYYLVDSAYLCTQGFLPPYPRVRYHSNSDHYEDQTNVDNLDHILHTPDMSSGATQAMAATRKSIAQPMWAHRSAN